jgi:hypothetical protein
MRAVRSMLYCTPSSGFEVETVHIPPRITSHHLPDHLYLCPSDVHFVRRDV